MFIQMSHSVSYQQRTSTGSLALAIGQAYASSVRWIHRYSKV